MRAEAAAGLAQRAWQRLFTPAQNDNHSLLKKIIQDNNEVLLHLSFFCVFTFRRHGGPGEVQVL